MTGFRRQLRVAECKVVSALAMAVALAAPALAQSPSAADVAAMQARLDAQDAQIKALNSKVDQLTQVLATRVSGVEAATDNGKVVMTAPSPRLESAGSNYSLAIVGVLQPEVGFYDQYDAGPGAPRLYNGTIIRRAQLGVQGSFGDFGYALVVDAAATGGMASAVRDAWISYGGLRPLTLTIGNQKPQSGMEPSFSDRSNASTFLEAGLPAALATVNGTRAIGARLSAGGAHYSASLGIFGDDINNASIANPVGDGWGFSGRLTVAPVATATRVLHFGVSGYERDPGLGRATTAVTDPVTSQLRYRSQPEITVDAARLVDTGLLTKVDHYSYVGAEAAAVLGPLSVQGEYAKSWVDQTGGRTQLQFDGAYVYASWMLTGESRVYDPRTGVFVRFKPKSDFDRNGGWGAWELAARWSTLDLNSHEDQLALGGVRGGELTDYTIGLNWYLSAWLRVMANYIHADSTKISATGVNQGTKADILGLRLHGEW
jgi:phosphate-selective porin OprO/OprP